MTHRAGLMEWCFEYELVFDLVYQVSLQSESAS